MIRLFVPGRLCLFGEHSDWAGSLRRRDAAIAPGGCILTGTEQGISAEVAPSPDFEMTSRLPDGSERGPFRCKMDDAALEQAATRGDFFSYAAGVALEVRKRRRVAGARIAVTAMDLPLGRGLSSSAAICVLTARAFNRIHGLGLALEDEMELAYRGERAAGSQCGRMDQACAFGRRLVQLGFDGERMSTEVIEAGGRFDLLIVDLLEQKNTRRILADLNAAFCDESRRAEALRAALGQQNLDLLRRVRACLEAGDAAGLGELMREAQDLFDRAVAPACPTELDAPRLHALLCDPLVRELTWGGKGVGSQGDGAAQLVCRGAAERDELVLRLQGSGRFRCLPLTVGSAV